jgi:hypothetical protein
MAASTPNWTLLQVNGSERPIYGDKKAGAPIKPGHVCVLAANHVVNPVTAADALTAKLIAVEASWANTDTTRTIQEQPYGVGDTVNYIYAQPGDLVYLHLAPNQNAAIGSALATAGSAGEVGVETTNKDATIIAIAEEAVVTGAGETKRIKSRII